MACPLGPVRASRLAGSKRCKTGSVQNGGIHDANGCAKACKDLSPKIDLFLLHNSGSCSCYTNVFFNDCEMTYKYGYTLYRIV